MSMEQAVSYIFFLLNKDREIKIMNKFCLKH